MNSLRSFRFSLKQQVSPSLLFFYLKQKKVGHVGWKGHRPVSHVSDLTPLRALAARGWCRAGLGGRVCFQLFLLTGRVFFPVVVRWWCEGEADKKTQTNCSMLSSAHSHILIIYSTNTAATKGLWFIHSSSFSCVETLSVGVGKQQLFCRCQDVEPSEGKWLLVYSYFLIFYQIVIVELVWIVS